MKSRKKVIELIIDWSAENTSGTIVSKRNIGRIVNAIYKEPKYFTPGSIDIMIDENESTRGFLVKTNDILAALPFKL